MEGKMSEHRLPWYLSAWRLNGILCGAAILWVLLFGDPLESSEMRWFDQALRWRLALGMAKPVDERIIHLDIDDADLAVLNSTELEYAAAAEIIREASDLGAEVVVFDVIFARGLPAMAKPILGAVGRCQVVMAEGIYPESGSASRSTTLRSFPFLEPPYSPSGVINIHADPDGVYRHYNFVQESPNGAKPSLALAAYLSWHGIKWPEDVAFIGKNLVSWDELSTDGAKLEKREIGSSQILLDFRSAWTDSGPAAFPHLTYADLHRLNENIPHGSENRDRPQPAAKSRPLAGKIVMVSYTATGVGDVGTTAFGAHTPLAHLHSMALNDLIQRTSHLHVSRLMDCLCLATALLMGLAAARLQRISGVIFFWLVGMGILMSGGLWLIWWNPGWVTGSLATGTLWSLNLIAEIGRRYACESIERRKLHSVFERCVSPEVMQKILDTPTIEDLLQGETMQAAVLFLDIRGFSTAAEKLPAPELLKSLNQHLEIIIESVLQHRGMINNFIGDAVLAVFNCPLPLENSATQAFRCSLDCQARLKALDQNQEQAHNVQLSFGIGLNYGKVVAGLVGSEARFNFSVIGDEVNLAARLESLTRHYPVDVVISEAVYGTLDNQEKARCLHLDRVAVKGRTSPLNIYTIYDFSENLAQHYIASLKLYLNGDFESAQAMFYEKQTKLHSFMALRCGELLNLPKATWPGHYTWDTK